MVLSLPDSSDSVRSAEVSLVDLGHVLKLNTCQGQIKKYYGETLTNI